MVTVNFDGEDDDPGNGICATVGGDCTLRAAIQEANALPGSQTITFAPTTNYSPIILSIAGDSEDEAYTGDLDLLEDVVITGNGKNLTVIDADSIDRVFHIPDEHPIVAEISEVTITGGDNNTAGGILHESGTLTIINSQITGNTANDGVGGISNDASLYLINSEVSNNVATTDGGSSTAGGIYNEEDGVMEISDSTISSNNGGYSGGICNKGTLLVISSQISGNSAYEGGGITNTDHLTLIQTEITGNQTSTDGNGGGILNFDEGSVDISGTYTGTLLAGNSVISGNTAGYGGGIFSQGDSAMVTIHSYVEIKNNQVTGFTLPTGGGIYNLDGTVELSGSDIKISGNLAGNGGGIANFSSGHVTIAGANISYNSVSYSGGGIFNTGTITITAGSTYNNTATYNGGGISTIYGGEITISGATVATNTTGNNGGGISNTGGEVTISNATLEANTAGNTGGGAFGDEGSVLTVTDSAINDNTAGVDGGGIYSSGSLTENNNTFSGNVPNDVN